jgi:hypothetical protein
MLLKVPHSSVGSASSAALLCGTFSSVMHHVTVQHASNLQAACSADSGCMYDRQHIDSICQVDVVLNDV